MKWIFKKFRVDHSVGPLRPSGDVQAGVPRNFALVSGIVSECGTWGINCPGAFKTELGHVARFAVTHLNTGYACPPPRGYWSFEEALMYCEMMSERGTWDFGVEDMGEIIKGGTARKPIPGTKADQMGKAHAEVIQRMRSMANPA